MISTLLIFSDSSSGLGALGFDGQAFVIQLITFLLAYLVLRRYAFGPITNMLRRRRETIESGVQLTEQLQKERAELETKVAKALQQARQEADDIIAGAQDTARQAIHEAEEKARHKAASVVAEAESRIMQDTTRARQRLEKELVGLVAEATEAIIEEKIDPQKDVALIDRALKEQQTA